MFLIKEYLLYRAAYRPAGAPNQAEDGGGEDEQGEDDLPGLHLFLIHLFSLSFCFLCGVAVSSSCSRF